MTDIAKCVCGAEAKLREPPNRYAYVKCTLCGTSGPQMASSIEATRRWNALFSRALTDERPRPVVTRRQATVSDGALFYLGHICIGSFLPCTVFGADDDGSFMANDNIALDHHKGTRDECIAWLITKLRDSGFDVQEAK